MGTGQQGKRQVLFLVLWTTRDPACIFNNQAWIVELLRRPRVILQSHC